MTWASSPTIAFNNDSVNTSLTTDNDAGASSTYVLDQEIGLIELELSRLQQGDPQAAARRKECYIQLGALCQLRKSKQATTSLSNFEDFSFDTQGHVLSTTPFPFPLNAEFGLAQPTSDSGIGTSQEQYFGRVGATDVSAFDLSGTNIQDHNFMSRPFTHDEDLSMTERATDSFANAYDDSFEFPAPYRSAMSDGPGNFKFNKTRMSSLPILGSINDVLAGAGLGNTQAPSFSGTLSGNMQNEAPSSILPPELPHNLSVFSSELNTRLSPIHQSESDELLVNPCSEVLGQRDEAYGENLWDQNTGKWCYYGFADRPSANFRNC